MELNTSQKNKDRVIVSLETKGATEELFDSVLHELYTTVLADTFRRFKTSELYQKHMKKKRRMSWNLQHQQAAQILPLLE